METINILNTGGTFNKRYDEIKGELLVAQDNDAVNKITSLCFRNNISLEIKGILFKDSLELTPQNREEIYLSLKNNKKTLIIHGTDTMDLTALYLDNKLEDQIVVLTGAMIPFSIDPIEAVSNFSMAMQFLQTCQKPGIYIAMHGLVKPFKELIKNRELGIFQCQK